MLASAPAAANEAEADRKASVRSSGDSYVFFDSGNNNSSMSGDFRDVKEARRLRRGMEPLLYVRRNGQAYVIRDTALLRQAEAIFRPQQELGARQGALGARQGALGAQQAALGARQAEAAVRLGTGRGSQEASRAHADLARQQSELGRQQSALGAEQGRLGQQQAQLAREAQAKLRDLLDNAIRSGLAQRID
jgi:hypothetical protein